MSDAVQSRLLLAVITGTLLALSLLGLRRERLEIMHEMAVLHSHIDRQRQEVWSSQTRAAEITSPRRLRRSVEDGNIRLQPVDAGGVLDDDTLTDVDELLEPVSPSQARINDPTHELRDLVWHDVPRASRR